MNSWVEDIEIEDLPESYREMAELIGVENTIKLAMHYYKQGFYFKSLDEPIMKKKEEYIKKNFDGRNHRELARATGLSERWVYEILKNGKNTRQAEIF